MRARKRLKLFSHTLKSRDYYLLKRIAQKKRLCKVINVLAGECKVHPFGLPIELNFPEKVHSEREALIVDRLWKGQTLVDNVFASANDSVFGDKKPGAPNRGQWLVVAVEFLDHCNDAGFDLAVCDCEGHA